MKIVQRLGRPQDRDDLRTVSNLGDEGTGDRSTGLLDVGDSDAPAIPQNEDVVAELTEADIGEHRAEVTEGAGRSVVVENAQDAAAQPVHQRPSAPRPEAVGQLPWQRLV